MGTWSAKPFGNDAALDWLADLESSPDGSKLIADTIDAVHGSEDPEEWPAEEAVAAATIVVAACSDPVRGLPKEAKAWVVRQGYVPDMPLVHGAMAVLEKILDRSELKALWEESGSAAAWLKNTRSILARLKAATEGTLPKRTPKKQGMPRVLHRMIAHYNLHPDETLRRRISEKFAGLPDPDEPTRETDYALPLCLAARYGLEAEVKLLLERGADPNGTSPITGSSPLTEACGNGRLRIAELLLAHGAELFKEILVDGRTGHPLEIVQDKENARPEIFRCAPALYSAARSGTPEVIDDLLRRGADVDQIDLNGETLLHKSCESGNIPTTRHLILLGLDVNKGKAMGDERPIHYAVRARQLAVTRVILEAGADPNALDSWRGEEHHWDISPLDLAMDHKDAKMIALLKEYGARTSAELLEERRRTGGGGEV